MDVAALRKSPSPAFMPLKFIFPINGGIRLIDSEHGVLRVSARSLNHETAFRTKLVASELAKLRLSATSCLVSFGEQGLAKKMSFTHFTFRQFIVYKETYALGTMRNLLVTSGAVL